MSIGLPAHLRPKSVSRAFTHATNTIAVVCLCVALVGTLTLYASDSSVVVWPAALALLPILATVWLVRRFRSTYFILAHMIIGAPAIYWFTLILVPQLTPLDDTDHFLISLPRVAMVMVGAAAATTRWGVIWCTIGLVVSKLAVGLAGLQLADERLFDLRVFFTYLGIVAVLIMVNRSQRGVRRVQSRLHRAARDNEREALRYGIEATSAAVMHDTVLGHLAAIANAPFGAMSNRLQQQIQRDLEFLVGEEWLSESTPEGDAEARADWQQSELLGVITEVRGDGLTVEVTGDLTALARLDSRGASALAPAVKQCLVNVLKHSGTDQAEVAIFGSDNEVSVLVVDSGKGFDEAETGEDRLGLRQSVRRRIELVDGTVQVWSAPGHGTSVMIRVPIGRELLQQAGNTTL